MCLMCWETATHEQTYADAVASCAKASRLVSTKNRFGTGFVSIVSPEKVTAIQTNCKDKNWCVRLHVPK